MTINLRVQQFDKVEEDWLIVSVFEDAPFTDAVANLDSALQGGLTRLREAGDLTGKLAEIVRLLDVRGIGPKRLLLVGLGKQNEVTSSRLMQALTTAVRDVCRSAEYRIAVAFPELPVGSALSTFHQGAVVATALVVGSVACDLYKAEHDRKPPKSMAVVFADNPTAIRSQAGVGYGELLGEGMNLTRELVNRHPGEIYPETFADRASQLAGSLGISCELFDLPRLKAERMGALLGVSQGSSRPPRVVVLKYQGASPDSPTLALVGKGVTFDSGGLSLKPSDSMKSMKADMAGAATVLGAICTMARLNLKVNVTAYLGLVENMTGGAAYKLGEVLTARNGVTIEVMNTDAEGRLVLADLLCYAVDQGASRIVDLATLTGACVVALGEEVTGLFPNNPELEQDLHAAAKRAGELLWTMPMFDSFSSQLRSEVADCQNIGTRWGGAITAAKFLQKFVGETPWVHLDIAGPAFAETSKPHQDSGGTGAILRTLIELVDPK